MKIDCIVVATNNQHKSREIHDIMAGLGISVKDLRDFPPYPEVEEDGDTLEANALKKARAAHERTGLPAIADDTGLEVYYLLGSPGVYSARYAGPECSYEDNNRKLLRKMTQVPARRRQARFRCVIALIAPGLERTFEGLIEGSIAFTPRGTNGFGYDPLFIPEGCAGSYAELSADEKNGISHRARAVKALMDFLEKGV
jgi:XTP/dITP diphosphohydrolase